jgi:hypothetical protein
MLKKRENSERIQLYVLRDSWAAGQCRQWIAREVVGSVGSALGRDLRAS